MVTNACLVLLLAVACLPPPSVCPKCWACFSAALCVSTPSLQHVHSYMRSMEASMALPLGYTAVDLDGRFDMCANVFRSCLTALHCVKDASGETTTFCVHVFC